jgi:tetratricopeptide (TPR) repeat protein
LKKIEKDTLNYYFNEDEMNSLGYAFLSSNKDAEAETVFKQNTLLFPLSWNAFDSYGEVLLKRGRKQDAVKMYRKSIELNPGNENGKKVLEQVL